jgi:hypothetical protein
MLDEKFVILGIIVGFIGSLSYLIDTIKGKTKPNRVTWFLWALAPLIAFTAEIKQGVGAITHDLRCRLCSSLYIYCIIHKQKIRMENQKI